MIQDQTLKHAVRDYWNQGSCGTNVATAAKHSRAYFEEIETYRYSVEPEISSFAQFSRAHGRRVLEVGVGAGTDFLQWVRSGAVATGIDLTAESVENVRNRLQVYDLQAEVLQADCEQLPFADNSFDIVYSWGVIHHTPDTWRALDEIVRVCRPGGTCKVMVYNRHSVAALHLWLRVCALAGRPHKTLSWALWNHQESLGTKAFTADEVRAELGSRDIAGAVIRSELTQYDRPRFGWSRRNRVLRRGARALAVLLGWRDPGWFMTIEFQKPASALA